MKDQILYDDKYLQLKRLIAPEFNINSYTYSHEIKYNGNIVVILPFKINSETFSFLLRKEIIPCWEINNYNLTSLTYGIDNTYIEYGKLIKFLYNETGYSINKDELIFLGESRGIKSCDTIYKLFSIDLTNNEKTNNLNDINSCVWIDNNSIFDCIDPFVSLIYVRLMKKFSDGLLL